MALYTRTTTVDSAPSGDTVKQAVIDVDTDLTGIVAAYNVHDPATTGVHGVGAGTVCGTTLTQTLTNKTLTSPGINTATITTPTITGTVTASGATFTGGTYVNQTVTTPTITGGSSTNMTITTPTITGGTHTNLTLVTPALGTPASGVLTNCTGLPQAAVVGLTTTSSPTFSGITLATGAANGSLYGAAVGAYGAKIARDTGNILTIGAPGTAAAQMVAIITSAGSSIAQFKGDGTSLLVGATTLSSLTASLPVFSDASKVLVSKSVADTQTALAIPAEGAWTSYGATSTVVGWAAGAEKSIYYKQMGKIVFVKFYISGTSDSTTTTFTLPSQNVDVEVNVNTKSSDNGTSVEGGGQANIEANSSTVILRKTIAGADYTASGSKVSSGEFFYAIA